MCRAYYTACIYVTHLPVYICVTLKLAAVNSLGRCFTLGVLLDNPWSQQQQHLVVVPLPLAIILEWRIGRVFCVSNACQLSISSNSSTFFSDNSRLSNVCNTNTSRELRNPVQATYEQQPSTQHPIARR